jgi:hypothetical protein
MWKESSAVASAACSSSLPVAGFSRVLPRPVRSGSAARTALSRAKAAWRWAPCRTARLDIHVLKGLHAGSASLGSAAAARAAVAAVAPPAPAPSPSASLSLLLPAPAPAPSPPSLLLLLGGPSLPSR